MVVLDSKELLREEEGEGDEDEQEEMTHEQEDYYTNLVSGPYMHIFLENFRKEVQKSSSSKRSGKFKYKGVCGDGVKNEEEEIIEPPMHEPPTTPLPADNLKSAMNKSSTASASTSKGWSNTGKGRLRKAVTWASDVYDPTPSADSHYMDASGDYGCNIGRTEWKKGTEKKINKGKNWQEGPNKNDDGERVKGSKNNAKKASGKNGIEGGDTANENGIGRQNKSESKESHKNPQKGVDNEVKGEGRGGGAKRGKEKDKKTGGRSGSTRGGRGGGGDNGGKGKDKKLGKNKGTKA